MIAAALKDIRQQANLRHLEENLTAKRDRSRLKHLSTSEIACD